MMHATSTAVEWNSLDSWAARRIGVSPDRLTSEALARHQLQEIQRTIAWARCRSSFYARQLAGFAEDWPRSLAELEKAPFTSPADLLGRAPEFLCVSQHEIRRVVTLETSGTSGEPKRIFFTAEDQGLALDFFAHGVATMSAKGDRMLIALPGEREGSVGFQLARGIERAGVVAIAHGLIVDPVAALEKMDREKATLLIGLPVQVLAVVLESGDLARRVFRRLRTIVLCSDNVPQSLAQAIRHATGCEVFEHYGSTEMGLGGGVDCHAHAGYHLREADLYFEIVSPRTGEALADGQLGEVVFTTLGRTGMPLVRYRTGDLSRIVPGPCVCGSPLRRLERVRNRIDSVVALGSGGGLTISTLDETLFAIPGLYDFAAAVLPGNPPELRISIYAPRAGNRVAADAEMALHQLSAIGSNCSTGELRLKVIPGDKPFPVTGAKRKIEVPAAQ